MQIILQGKSRYLFSCSDVHVCHIEILGQVCQFPTGSGTVNVQVAHPVPPPAQTDSL